MLIRSTGLGLLALALLCAGCGDEPSATKVRYPFTLKTGDGIQLALKASVRTAAVGVEDKREEMIVRTTLDARCTEVTAAGERRLQFTPREFSVDGAVGAPAEQPKPRVLRIGPDRSHRGVEMDGETAAANTPASNPFVTGGFLVYLPLAPGGMAIGQTYELARGLPKNVLPTDLEQAVLASEAKPAFEGIYTLRSSRVEDGVLIGDFDIRLALTFEGSVQVGPSTINLAIDMRCRGTQSFDLATGLATGPGASKVTQRVEMGAEGLAHTMRTSAEVEALARPLR